MRFVFAIAAFVIAAAMIAGGIAQRTVFAPPETLSLSTTVADAPPYLVIDGSTLGANPGRQTISVSGSDTIFLAYGRSTDVTAWLGDNTFARIGIEEGEKHHQTLTSSLVNVGANNGKDAADSEAASADPVGSDLWLEEFTSKQALIQPLNIPDDMSVIVASDGRHPAPDNIRISWPLDTSTPWVGPLLVGGGLLLLIGLGLYVWAWRHMRRSRGPRRTSGPKSPKMPKLPKTPRYRGKPHALPPTTKGRRSISRSVAVVPIALVMGVAITGCSSDVWPDLRPVVSAAPTAEPVAPAPEVIPPAVTVPQLERILLRVSTVAKEADADRDAKKAAERFAGSALEMRKANYAIRGKVKDYQPLPAIPAAPLTLSLPQATDAWPRTVLAIVQDKGDPAVAPTALVLNQASPRENYMVQYAVSLEPDVTVPKVAPPSVGAPIVAPDTKLLKLAPDQLALAYADILNKGEESEYYPEFKATGDSLRAAVGLDYKNKKRKDLPKTAELTFSSSEGSGPDLALGTNDSGAIVAVDLNEVETVKPVKEGATVEATGAAKKLSGIDASTKGIKTTYLHQLLFYVPAVGSSDKIVLLGFSQSLISSSEVK